MKRYDFNGKKLTIKMIQGMTDFSETTLRNRLKTMSVEEAIKKPVYKRKKVYLYKGNKYHFSDLVKIAKVNADTLSGRLYNLNMTIEEAVDTPPKPPFKLYELDGQMLKMSQLIRLYPKSETTLKRKIYTEGMTVQQAFDKARQKIKKTGENK